MEAVTSVYLGTWGITCHSQIWIWMLFFLMISNHYMQIDFQQVHRFLKNELDLQENLRRFPSQSISTIWKTNTTILHLFPLRHLFCRLGLGNGNQGSSFLNLYPLSEKKVTKFFPCQSVCADSEWGMAGNAGKSTPSPSAFRSPSKQGRSSVTPSPRKQWSPSKQCSPSKQWSPSPRKDMESSPMVNERSWYCDAIDAIQSINDIRRSKEGRLHTESVSLGNSPAGKSSSPRPRPPHAFSAEKKMLRRAFSWYVSEHDERMRTFGLKGRSGSKEPEEDDNGAQKPLSVPSRAPIQRVVTSVGRQGGPTAKKGDFSAICNLWPLNISLPAWFPSPVYVCCGNTLICSGKHTACGVLWPVVGAYHTESYYGLHALQTIVHWVQYAI